MLLILQGFVSWKHESDKVVAFERAAVLFVFNFHVSQSFTDYQIGVNMPGEYKIILNSDDPKFGGHNRIDTAVSHFTSDDGFAGRKYSIKVCIEIYCTWKLIK